MQPLPIKLLSTLAVGTALGGILLFNATAENTTPSPSPAPTTAATDKPDAAMHHEHHHGDWAKNGGGWGDGKMAGMDHRMGMGGGMGWMRHGMHHHGETLMSELAGLDLTPDQKAKAESITKGEEAQIKAIHEQAKNQIKSLISNDTVQLLPMLTPQQQQILSDKAKLQADEAALKQSDPNAGH